MMRTRIIALGLVLLAGEVWAEAAAEPAKEGESRPVVARLFNGEDFGGWKLFVPDPNVAPETVWEVRDGVGHCKGQPAGYMRTTQAFSDYRLEFEWRWLEQPGNSGVLLHITGEDKVWPKSIEAQLKSGDAGDFWVIDGTDFKEHVNKDERRVPKKAESNEKPIGDWNKMEIECQGNTIRVYVNGLLQNEATETTVERGYIGFQSEGAPIEFRNIVLKRSAAAPPPEGK